ncbi:hypothetical protein C8Q78DRAFT_1080830 [Trametes maxima]|nr:hypothetical protein C8Q78DRAFT_1080830 [Trametes maxima]
MALDSAAVPTDTTVPSLALTFGLLLIGTFLGLVFYGITLYQTVWYLRAYASDPRRLKLTVVAVLYCAFFALRAHMAYASFSSSALSQSALGTSSSVVTLATGLVAEFLLTSALIAILYQSRTGIKRTDSLLNVLMVYTINTGMYKTATQSFMLRTTIDH